MTYTDDQVKAVVATLRKYAALPEFNNVADMLEDFSVKLAAAKVALGVTDGEGDQMLGAIVKQMKTIATLKGELGEALQERDDMTISWTGPEATKALLAERDAAREALAKAVEEEREAAALKAMEWARVTPFPKRHALVHLSDEDFACLVAETEAENRSARAIAAAIRARKEPTT